MSGPVQIVLIVAVVCYMLVRRLAGEPAQAKRMLILPVVLTAVGVSNLTGHVTSTISVLFLVATAGISVILGAARGASVRISQRDGVAFVRYTAITIVLWVVNLAIKFGANLLLGAIDPTAANALSNSLLVTLGLGILAEGLVVLCRALRNGHQVMWSQDRDGAQRRTSPFLDNPRRGTTGYDDNPPSGWNTPFERDHRR